MQIKITFKSLILFLLFISSIVFGSDRDHLTKLKTKFPYGLLSDDFGVLALSDLEINACYAYPKPFNPTASDIHSYEYWQCFENKNISFNCDSNGSADKYEGVMGLIIIKILDNNVLHTYLEHRLWPIKQCRGFNKDAKLLLKGVKHVCFSGAFISQEINSNGKKEMYWNFERVKTKKGCEGRGCDFTQEFKKNNCPNFPRE